MNDKGQASRVPGMVSNGKINRPKLKQLVFLPDFDQGGVSRTVSALNIELDKNFVETKIYLLRNVVRKQFLDNRLNVSVIAKRVKSYSSLLWVSPLVLFKVASIIRREKPDVIVSHGLLTNCILAFLKALRVIDKPTIAFEHNNPSVHYSITKLGALKRFLINKLYPVHSIVFGVSQGVVDDLIKICERLNKNCAVLYNGFDIDEINRKSAQSLDPFVKSLKRNGLKTVVAVGRAVEQKDYMTLLKAIADSQRCDTQYLILGQGELLNALKEKSQSIGCKNVYFLGDVENPFPIVAVADLFVLTSIHEAFGNVLVEALSLGVPVISTDCPSGPREILDNGRYGRLVPVGDWKMLSGLIDNFFENKLSLLNEKSVLVSRAKEFSLNRQAKSYLAHVSELISLKKV